MHFFIVDNGSIYIDDIIDLVANNKHTYTVQSYSFGKNLTPNNTDCIILSGGIKQNYTNEYELIQTTNIPILGICIGMQLIVKAFGGTLRKLPSQVYTDSKQVQLNKSGQSIFGKQRLTVHEKHQYVVDEYANTGLEILGNSDDGVEIVYHPTKRIIGTQFHPEIKVTPESVEVFWSLVNTVAKTTKEMYAT